MPFFQYNVTGRVFMALTNSPALIECDESFVEGEIYFEALVDSDNENHITDDEDILLMLTRDNVALYVDADDFILLDYRLPQIFTMPISKS